MRIKNISIRLQNHAGWKRTYFGFGRYGFGYPNRPNGKQTYRYEYGLTQAGFTVFMKGRLKFLQNGVSKGTAPFPTMLLYYGSDWEKKAKRWVKEQPIPGTLMVRGS